jgi:hypothetical protein
MTMNARKTILATLLAAVAVSPLAMTAVQAQQYQGQVQGPQRSYSQAELDQMLAPIALYPDALLSQILMASTYPAQVSAAARWSRANPGLQGDDAVRAAQYQDWDPSVQSLVAFPQVLARMGENPGWTQSLGDAFLMQEPHVMDTVQQLRRRAQAAGNLQSSEQMYVQQQGQAIVIQPASPQYVYVPYYDPLVVYGPWWWPAYKPVVWAPWAGYARPYRPGVSVGFWWGTPVGLSFNFFFGNVNWHQRQVRVVHPSAYYYRPHFAANHAVAAVPSRWQHESRAREDFAERRAVQPARTEHRDIRVAPAQVQVQTQIQPAAQPGVERREERQAPRAQVQPQPRAQTEFRPQPAVRAHTEVRAQPQPQPQAQVRREPRARMPEAIAPQQPRAQQQEPQRERRGEPKDERGPRGRERS